MTEDSKLPFHPVLSAWFASTFGEPTDVQTKAWASIAEGQHTLIAAPTGSGKTLAALLPCLDRIARSDAAGKRQPAVRTLYITPLKALNNDIHHHVTDFARQLDAWAAERGEHWPGIRSEVRTGDTTPAKRAAMLRRPPDLLVTTPESFYLLLTSGKGRDMLATVEQVIVDEIHDLAADKRGSHLSLSLERLTALCARPVQRIGVSATQKPLSRVAQFLGGWEESPQESAEEAMQPRPVAIVESGMTKRLSVKVTMPEPTVPSAGREAVWKPLLDRIMEAMSDSRSVLLFVNSRRLSERLTLRLNDHVGYEMARSHHGSLARERRLEAERLLKSGELRCIVATSSLELGIDIGHIDLVIQIDTPLAADRGIQRIGRAGHAVGEESRGLMIVRAKALLPEAAVLSRLVSRREIEDIEIPYGPMDVLSQQAVAIVSMDDWRADDLLRLVRRSDSYRDYDERRFKEMLKVLSGFYPFFKPLLDWDARSGLLTARAVGRAAAVSGAGTIPQSGGYPVHHMDSRAHLGELDEEFIQESRVGDVFQLGAGSWMIREIKNDRVYVAEAANRFSEVPFWRNEAGGRSYALGEKIGAFWREIAGRLGLEAEAEVVDDTDGENAARERAYDDAVATWLRDGFGMDAAASESLIGHVRAQHRASAVPTDARIVVEHYRDVMNQTHMVIHNFFGRSVNRAWLLALQRQFELLMPYRLYGNAKDNGIEIVLPEWDASWLRILSQVSTANVETLLSEAVTGSPLLAVAFRKIAETSLLLARSFTRTPMWQKRLRSEELLRKALPYGAQFPYLGEAMREALHDYLSFGDLRRMLEAVDEGRIEIVVRETPYPSPLASQFMADYVNMRIYEGDGLDESTRRQILQINHELARDLFGGADAGPAVSEEAMAQMQASLSSPSRDPEGPADLASLLKTRGDLTAGEIVKAAGERSLAWLSGLEESGAAVAIRMPGDEEPRYIASDEAELYARFPADPASVLFILGRYADHRMSFTEADLVERYPMLDLPGAAEAVRLLLERELIQRAPHASGEDERLWTSVQVASKLVRWSVRHARSQAEPADAIRWCSQIAMLQHALPGSQMQGGEGLLAAIGKLQGIFLPLSHWETLILPARVQGYRKEDLDLLCATGEVLWIGRREEEEREGKIAFFLADDKALYEPYAEAAKRQEAKTRHPQLAKLIRESGASFLTKLSRETDMRPSELLPALIDLAWEGLVSNDQFAPLRLHTDPAGAKRQFQGRTGSGLGRWYAVSGLLESASEDDNIDDHSPSSRSSSEAEESPVLAWTKHLLDTYGMVNRELVSKVSPYPWDVLQGVLRQLEDWGLVTRGAFIRGLDALQFATPAFRDAVKRPAGSGDGQLAVLSAADPANPFGLIAEWPSGGQGVSFARKPGNFLLLDGEKWRYWIENNGKRVFSLEADAVDLKARGEAERLQAAFQTIIRRQKLVKLKMDEWNGKAAAETEAGRALLSHGAEKQMRSLVLWLKT
ncbi:ATP-dependent helicase Lhr and Lhr-like helicase [Cohnella sp. OV330]|uniref:DEAD/DEAH box helicase n=1 Tax=Cohnella sp. OV330 TaxID=1855288 RepID=UPI0008EB484D|nr:DEAD/DEAH box helicase [Cohnella sp. OV330]SFB44264.1 ATP-dependent helicase Lhr and Lhr-like helicase [Cohnella sp. OV330]